MVWIRSQSKQPFRCFTARFQNHGNERVFNPRNLQCRELVGLEFHEFYQRRSKHGRIEDLITSFLDGRDAWFEAVDWLLQSFQAVFRIAGRRQLWTVEQGVRVCLHKSQHTFMNVGWGRHKEEQQNRQQLPAFPQWIWRWIVRQLFYSLHEYLVRQLIVLQSIFQKWHHQLNANQLTAVLWITYSILRQFRLFVSKISLNVFERWKCSFFELFVGECQQGSLDRLLWPRGLLWWSCRNRRLEDGSVIVVV